MPIKTIKTDLEWGQNIYVKNDPFQTPHHLVGILCLPAGAVKFSLQAYEDLEPFLKYDFECTTEPGEVKEFKEEED